MLGADAVRGIPIDAAPSGASVAARVCVLRRCGGGCSSRAATAAAQVAVVAGSTVLVQEPGGKARVGHVVVLGAVGEAFAAVLLARAVAPVETAPVDLTAARVRGVAAGGRRGNGRGVSGGRSGGVVDSGIGGALEVTRRAEVVLQRLKIEA